LYFGARPYGNERDLERFEYTQSVEIRERDPLASDLDHLVRLEFGQSVGDGLAIDAQHVGQVLMRVTCYLMRGVFEFEEQSRKPRRDGLKCGLLLLSFFLDELGAARTEAPRGGLWSERPLTELIDFILERFHAPLRSDLPALVELAKKVEDVHAGKPSCPRGIAQHLAHVLVEVEIHLAKEERILFPLIRAGRGPTALMPIKVMMQEHEDHGVNLRRTRALTGDLAAPPEACASWRSLYQGLAQLEADLMEHIHLENNVLFPRALREAPSEAAL